MRFRLALLAVCICAGLAALTAPAVFAQSSTENSYAPVAGQEISSGNGNGNGAEPKTSGSSLPFTGFEIGLVALVGAGLLGTGLVVRRASRTEPGHS